MLVACTGTTVKEASRGSVTGIAEKTPVSYTGIAVNIKLGR